MGTRGMIGFRADGQDFIAYNHFDSYPTELGSKMLKYARDTNFQGLRSRVASFTRVDLDGNVTVRLLKEVWPFVPHEAESPEAFIAKAKQERRDASWYSVFQPCQGSLDPWVQGLNVWPDYEGFQYSGSCEWGYLINLDAQTFELYTGHWMRPGTSCSYRSTLKPNGRFAVPPVEAESDQGLLLLESLPLAQLSGLSDSAIDRYCARLNAQF